MTNPLHPPRDGNGIGDYTLHDFAAKWMMQQADIAGIHHYQDANLILADTTTRELRIVLFGDSITEFWQIDPSAIAGLDLINRGIAGQNSSQMLLRFEDDVVALKPRGVVILAGTNDLRSYVGDPAELADSALARIKRNLTAMADIADARGISVVLATLPPVGTDPGVLRSAGAVRTVNLWIARFATRRGYGLADYHSVLTDRQGNLDARFSEDGVHPNAAGYERMMPLVLNRLKAIAAANPTTTKGCPNG